MKNAFLARNTSRFLPALFVFCASALIADVGGPGACPREQRPLPEDLFPVLDQILRESAEQSWRMIEEGLRVAEARAEADVAAADRYPSLSGSFRFFGRVEDRDDFDRSRSFYHPQAVLTARQPLYRWGAIHAGERIGRIRSAIAEENRVEAYRLLALTVRASFLDLAVMQKSIDLAEHRLLLAKHQLSLAQALFARGDATSEVLRERELAAREATLEFERSRRELELAIRDFSRVTGFEPFGREWLPSGIPPIAEAPAQGIGLQYPLRPWEEISLARIRQAREQLVIEAARQRPGLDLVAGVAQDQVAAFNNEYIDRVVYFAGIELTWNLFDGHETRGRRSAALARKRLETQRHARQEREWAEELDRLEEAVEWAARGLAVSEERWELAGRNLSLKEEDLGRGLISEADLAEFRIVFAERELDVAARRSVYLMAVAEAISRAGFDPAMKNYIDVRR